MFVCAVSIAIMLTPLTMIDPSNMRIVQYYSVFGLLVLPKCLISIQFRYNMDLSMIVFLFLAALYSLQNGTICVLLAGYGAGNKLWWWNN